MTGKPPSISTIVAESIPLPGAIETPGQATAPLGAEPSSPTVAWQRLTTALGVTVPAHVNAALASARRLRGLG